MSEWPFNGKSLWHSLSHGQRFAVIVGVPCIHLMLQGFNAVIHYVLPWSYNFPWIWFRAIIQFIAFFALPLLYVRGIGMFIAVAYDIINQAIRRGK